MKHIYVPYADLPESLKDDLAKHHGIGTSKQQRRTWEKQGMMIINNVQIDKEPISGTQERISP